jgi:hypothetical protein
LFSLKVSFTYVPTLRAAARDVNDIDVQTVEPVTGHGKETSTNIA